jgi:hypothetical protein
MDLVRRSWRHWLGIVIPLAAGVACNAAPLRPRPDPGDPTRIVYVYPDGYSSGDGSGKADGNTSAGDEWSPGDSDVCAQIEMRAGSCPGYGYDCPAHSVEESLCLLDMLQGLDDPCTAFVDGPECAGGEVTLYGYITCWLEYCFELNDPNTCLENYATLCLYTP